jgi:hypothetical protein
MLVSIFVVNSLASLVLSLLLSFRLSDTLLIVSNKSLNDLDLQETKDLFNEKIQIAKSYFESLKTIAENLKKNNFNLIGSIFGESLDLGNKTVDVFNKIQSFQTDYNKANNPEDKAKIKSKFDTDFLKMGFEETLERMI